ncbi:MAG: HEAT repeat domain-containing protein [Planctomycetales bacterium]|nr:HEAT repeat domain-containing protein [Planctomycetales bacterium]
MARLVIVLGVCFLSLCVAPPSLIAADSVQLSLSKGDRIAIIGNTLPERMQHDGWMETRLQSRFPDLELSVRSLAYSADALDEQLRVEGFGSQDEWLSRVKADVVFAFFGFNESFAGEKGLDDFKGRLSGLVKKLGESKYNGESAPKVVLFSPIACENLHDPNLPDGVASNARIAIYTEAMKDVAAESDVVFVDLYAPTLAAYESAQSPLTINGIHLKSEGNRVLAEAIDVALFGDAPESDAAALEKIRQAVLDKNFYWFHRYQTTDGFNVHGGRSNLNYNGVTNRVVMDREMEVLESMAALRDPKIWAAARGVDYEVDDTQTPELMTVETNLRGKNPDGSHEFLGGVEAISPMKTADGMQINLFASEEKFPELVNPVQMAFDTKGRLFVCAWETYPHWRPKDAMNDKLLILKDNNNDGQADECVTFADGLHNPTGFEFWGGGVIVAMAPDLLFLQDTDGDDKVDVRKRILHGLSSGDTHHTANSFVLDPGGALYFGEGVFHRTQIETPYGPVRNRDGCIWRFEPRTWKVDRFVSYGFANPHGHVYDDWGQGFIHDGTGADPYHDALFSGVIDYPKKHRRPPFLYNKRTRPCPATEILSSRHFPEANQGNLLVENVIGFQGILQYNLLDKGASFTGQEIEPIMQSDDRSFRPVDLEMAPDGSLYFTDWQNPIIGHMQHHIRDPNRDKTHGRVYRVTYPSRPLLQPAKIDGASIVELLELLKSPEYRTRYRAKIELSERPTSDVVAATEKWIAGLDTSADNYEHDRLEGLWVYQHHNVVNEELLKQVLRSPEPRARAAATRVLCYWRDRVGDPLGLLEVQATDDHPRVRLEAVRACSFFTTSRAAEVALASADKPTDEYLDFVLEETLNQLEQFQ